MPEKSTEALRSFFFALRHGFPFQRMAGARRDAAIAAGADPDSLLRTERLPARGRGNLQVSRLHYPDRSIVRKTVVSTPEFRVSRALAALSGPRHFARVYHAAQRGPVFHIFLEDLPGDCGDLDPEEFARLANGFSQEADPLAGRLGISRARDYDGIDERFLRMIASEAGSGVEPVRRGIAAIRAQPWKLQHNDLYKGNIRRREDGRAVVFDFGTVAVNLVGADLARLLPQGPEDRAAIDWFGQVLAVKAELSGLTQRDLVRAALLYRAVRDLRFARRHRNRARARRAAGFAARALDGALV